MQEICTEIVLHTVRFNLKFINIPGTMGDDIPFSGRGSRMLPMTTHGPTYSS